jgi:GntR family galactonate operon transcriptional repressor
MTLNKTDRIVISLGKQIVSGKYVPGSALPAEAELCEEFETSRNIIREVFRSLMAKRLIEMKRYRGAFVAPRNQWNYLDTEVLQWVLENDYDPRLISAMSEVRNLVEPAIARWAAERATSSDLAEIESALNDMIANNQNRDAFNEADIRYHEAVLQSVHNPVYSSLAWRSARYSERYLNGPGWAMKATCRKRSRNIKRCSMRYGIRTAMRQSRRR